MKVPKLSGNAQTALVISLAALFLIWRLFLKNTDDKEAQAAADKLGEESKAQIPALQQPTLSQTEALNLAEQMYIAMKGWGTDEESLYSAVMELSNEADAALVDRKFGIRDGQSLGAWIISDGEAAEVANLLSQKGITYTFQAIEL